MKRSQESCRFVSIFRVVLMFLALILLLTGCLDFGSDKDNEDDNNDDDESASEEDISDACDILIDLEEYSTDEEEDCRDDLADEDACVVECILDNETDGGDCLDSDSGIYQAACDSDSEGDNDEKTPYEKCLSFCEKEIECYVPDIASADPASGMDVVPADGDDGSVSDGDDSEYTCNDYCDSVNEQTMQYSLPIYECAKLELCEDFKDCVMDGGIVADGDEYTDGDYSTDGDVSDYCELLCSEEGIGLSCGTGSMTCNNSYDSSGRISYVSCSYSNGKYFSCSINYDSMGDPHGTCNGEGDTCYF